MSNSLETDFCLAMLEKALQHQKPDIINSDQGCQFTSQAWIQTLEKEGIQISMDGQGRCLDNVYIERFWRSLKYEDLYVNPPQTVSEARQTIALYMEFYNHERFHQSLKYQVPAELYFPIARRGLMDTVDNSSELPTVSTVCNNNTKTAIRLDQNATKNKPNIYALN